MSERIISLLLANGSTIFLVFVFVCTVLLILAISNITAGWADVRRRALAGTQIPLPATFSNDVLTRDLAKRGMFGSFLPASEAEKTRLRQFLNLAGYYSNSAPATYQFIRILSAAGFGLGSAIIYGRFMPGLPFVLLIGFSLAVAFFGYILPRAVVSLRRDRLLEEHRNGFPDFLDLLVICIEAGIGVETAVERVSKDLARTSPSLARNLAFMNMELRAGRSTRDALDNLSIRLGIEEARSFATVVQQAEELGSSLVQSLRVYAEEMRAKRLARAEEKANALPVKMVIPLAFFIFPVILGITLMPVAIKVYQALGIK